MAGMRLPRWLFPALVIVLIGAVVAVDRLYKPDRPPAEIACADLHAGCTARFDGREVQVGVVGPMKALAPFEVRVKGAGIRKVQASFAMKDMDMGFNLYALRPASDGSFRTRVTLPVCVSGRRDWIMVLDVDGRKFAVPFVTEL